MAETFSQVTHPSIIITSGEFAAQQAKVSSWPWSTMKTKAVTIVTTESYDNTADVRTEGPQAQKIIGALALSYILVTDATKKASYVTKFESDVPGMMSDLRSDKNAVLGTSSDDVGYNSILGGAVFMAYIAMDIMYSDLDARRDQVLKPIVISWLITTTDHHGLKVHIH